MRTVRSILIGIAASVALVFSVTEPRIGFVDTATASPASDFYKQIELLGNAIDIVRKYYVEKPNDEHLIESAINGILSGLDPHSSYMSAKSYREMQTETRGEFGGLGIEMTMEEGLIKVVSPIEDTPAFKAGILAGDVITHLDDEPVQGLTLAQAVDKMRGPVNSKIKLKIIRKGTAEPIEVTLVRAKIQVQSVRSRVENDIGYIRISLFSEPTTSGLKRALKDITEKIAAKKFRGFVLDLRNNPGGLLLESITVSEVFLKGGQEIVSTRGRSAEETQRFRARRGDLDTLTRGKPLIVLINGGSASASEIVAGALQDHKRATIIGTRSFGKGSVQTIIPLGGDFGALRLTTARYYTPSGRTIQAVGITPDIEVLQVEPEELKGKTDTKGESSLKGHLKTGDKEEAGSQSYIPPDPANDAALNMAFGLLRGTATNPAFPPVKASH